MTSPGVVPAPFPLRLELTSPLKVARWRPLIHWLLVIPQVLVLYVLLLLHAIVAFLSWFAILFTGKMPDGMFGFMAMTMRYQWRVTSFMLFMREGYPPFEFQMGGADPATDPAQLFVQPAPKLSRGLIFVKWLLVIPHLFVLLFLGIAAYAVIFIAFFAVLITGSWPEGMRKFVIGVFRWGFRVTAYEYFMTDVYPPFSLS